MLPHRRRNRRPNGYVLLDSAWAKRLGVQRTGGLYRISRRDLAHRLAEPQPDDIAAFKNHSHVVGFYETEAHLADTVRDYLTSGLHAGAAAIVVATASHRDLFGRALTEAGVDLPEAQRCGRYLALDASDVLATFMVGSVPDPARFEAAIGSLVSQAADGPGEVRIYGEMVAVLWDQGNVAAAIALEDLWNDLATRYPFSLFCAYPLSAFDTGASAEQFRTICGQHSRVISTPCFDGPHR
jgi:hypothetical protein